MANIFEMYFDIDNQERASKTATSLFRCVKIYMNFNFCPQTAKIWPSVLTALRLNVAFCFDDLSAHIFGTKYDIDNRETASDTAKNPL